MKTQNTFEYQMKVVLIISIFLLFIIPINTLASGTSYEQIQQNQPDYTQYSGIVVDSQTDEPLVFASLSVEGTNISTITNTAGEFLIKIPDIYKNAKIVISILGYKKKTLSVSQLNSKKNRIKLDVSVVKLSEVVFNIPKDAKTLVKSMFSLKKENYSGEHNLMTAFYRETIKKRRKNASLAEAIVNVYKEPYTNARKDKVKLYKVRKSTDYSKLDTVALKLEGGPFNALFVDLMKYPDYIFTKDEIYDLYNFTFSTSTTIDGRSVYVVKFDQKSSVSEPRYYGKLFIDAQSRALASAIFNLDVSNVEKASELFVKRKPKDIEVIPESVAYRVDYRESDGKWYYSYSNAQLQFKIKRKGKLFNSVYTVNSEMAITDRKTNEKKERPTYKEGMRQSIIISDEASGFSDPDFWGAFNVIEPEKSIEVAIKKIQKQLTSD